MDGGEVIEQLPGQMNVYDYPELLTSEMAEKVRIGVYRGTSYDGERDLQRIPGGKE